MLLFGKMLEHLQPTIELDLCFVTWDIMNTGFQNDVENRKQRLVLTEEGVEQKVLVYTVDIFVLISSRNHKFYIAHDQSTPQSMQNIIDCHGSLYI